jgi:Calcineurin-like phosphoesterase
MAERIASEAKDLERRLHRGELPQMVDWFDPLVLGMVAVRTLISTTIGAYADQRPMQQVMDGDVGEALTRRHDYSVFWGPNAVFAPESDPNNKGRYDKEKYQLSDEPRVLKLDNGAMWVDFIADLGDGFEATYGMAYLLAAEKLQVRGTARKEILSLPAGQMLIFGGDLAYPNSTLEEYRTRCIDPYNWAFTAGQAQPNRELFFVAGNHDWYDGLSAFTHQFCYESETIGGWRCTQRRSYFAIKLPYNWWIWGVDVALGDSIDAGQVEYFKEIAKGMKLEDNAKVVIILHAPDWTKRSYKGLERVCEEARQTGEICAILAGDLHHYSRYRSFDLNTAKGNPPRRDPPLELIVAGGGGAFTHPTHDLKPRLKVDATVAGRTLLSRGAVTSVETVVDKEKEYDFRARKFYPSRGRSRLLALQNLWLPFHNRRFTLLLGFIYFFYAWVFNISVPAQFLSPPSSSIFELSVANAAAVAATVRTNPTFFFMLLGLWVGLVAYVDAKLEHRRWKWLNGPIKFVFGTLHFLLHIKALLFVSALTAFLANKVFDPAIGGALLNVKLLVADFWHNGSYVSGAKDVTLKSMEACAAKLDWSGSAAETWSCVHEYVGRDAFFIGISALSYAVISIIIGGVIGALIFGCYWVVTSILFGMHQDAFSALANKNYKNFLRMKFEEEQLTIYPIGVDRIPGAKEWRAWDGAQDAKLEHRPLLVPKSQMKPRLIDEPIIIKKGTPPLLAQRILKGS